MRSVIFDDFSVNAAAYRGTSVNSHDHFECLKLDTLQGHTLDKAYQVNGQKIDAVIYDYKELIRQGKKVPAELVEKAETISADLRKEWWALCVERETFWQNHTRASEGDTVPLESFTEKIKAMVLEFL